MKVAHLETMVGKKVRDSEGKIAGRLAEVHADWRGEECVVTHYVLASKKARSTSLTAALLFILRQLGAEKSNGTVIVPWDKLDLEKLQLKCRVEELA